MPAWENHIPPLRPEHPHSNPVEVQAAGGRKGTIVPEGLEKFQPKKQPAKCALLVALARAFRWKELLETGQVSSMRELAKKFRVDAFYLSLILRLTQLTPDIAEAIQEGKEPSGLSLARIAEKLAIEWDSQRSASGFGIIPLAAHFWGSPVPFILWQIFSVSLFFSHLSLQCRKFQKF